jgi:hypothetical protein
MPATLVFGALTALFVWLAFKAVAVISSPLNAIPNAHITAPFSRIWLLWIRGTGREFTTRLAAHRQLGPIIRLGPQEISIDCVKDGVRIVYGDNWEKSSMYNGFKHFG